jgi:hypothetical protein
MKLIKVAGLVLAGLIMIPSQAFAANAVLSDVFDGSEMKTDPLPDSCGGDRQLAYQDTVTFEVSVSGEYQIFDAFNFNGVDVTALIYSDKFDPSNPDNNLVTPDGIDYVGSVELDGGVSYNLVVQRWCSNVTEGAWAITISGPGNVISDNLRMVPAFTEGVFTGADPTYHESGPLQVAETGKYYYSDVVEWDVDACIQIHTAPFDPANPSANRVEPNSGGGYLDDIDSIDLEEGTDYYIVVQAFNFDTFDCGGYRIAGEYFFVLAPPAPFRINKALAGAWVEVDFVTSGQGILMDVFDNLNLMFMAWFTYDLERPDPSYTAMIGEPGHRWMTAQGPYEHGNRADLPIYWNSGMIFDSATPATEQVQDGSLSLEFNSCNRAMLTYDLGVSGRTGEIPLQTVVDDHVELCEQLTEVPGMPGPL